MYQMYQAHIISYFFAHQMTASHPALSLPPSALWQPVAPGTTGDTAFGHNKENSPRDHGVFTDKTTYMTGTQWECLTSGGLDSIGKKNLSSYKTYENQNTYPL